MKFQLGNTIVELRDPAQYPQTPDTELIQAIDLSASGVPHVESFDVQANTTTYNFKNMHVSDYIALMGFFVNDAQGMLNEFTLTNDLGEVSDVRFATSKLKGTLTSFERYQVVMTVKAVK